MRIVAVDSKVAGDAHFVRIVSSDGTVGYGQSACWGYPQAVHAVIESFRPYLLGADPRRIEHHWQHLYRMGPFRGSVLTAGVSAIDIALWDLKGKAWGVPVHELLGGAVRDRIRLHVLLPGAGVEELETEARQAVAEGFTAIKFDPLPRDYYDLSHAELTTRSVEIVRAVRDVVGDSVDLIVELHRSLTPLQAPTMIAALQPMLPLFIEDPIQIDSISSQADIAKGTKAPIGAGERLNSIWEFRELLAQGGTQFVRPDIGLAGGITHVKKIAAIAESFHSAVVNHNCLGPLLTQASLHLDASIPNFVVQEYSLADETKADPALVPECRREGGWMPVPAAPGIGIDVDWDAIRSQKLVGRAIETIPLRRDGSVAFAV